MVSDSELVTRLREILRESDLDTATAGSVRKQLEQDFNVDLFDKKGFVRDQIDIYLETLNQDNEKQEQEPQSENESYELQEDEDGSQNSRRASKGDKKVKKRGGGFQIVCNLSPQLQKVLGESKLARTEVVKKLWVYIKENNLQDPQNKRNIVCDELLHAVFRVNSINMFQMNKALTKHIWPLTAEDEDSNHEMECEDGDDSVSMNAKSSKAEEKEEEKEGGDDDSVSISAESLKEEKEEGKEDEDNSVSISAERLKEEKEEEKEDGDDSVSINDESSKEEEKEEEKEGEQEEEEEQEGNARGSRNKRPSKVDKDVKKRRGGGFTKLCSLSPQLQAFIGEPELARTEVVKRLWAYIREKNLQDPKDKRNILCDESLHDLFHLKSINMFQMNKALSKHIWPLNEADVQTDSAQTERKSKQARETVQTGFAKTERKSKQARETDAHEPKQKAKKQKKGASGFLAPLTLSDALVKFFATGENALSRADVVKKMWEYIKQNDLQDPSDKRRILCDDKLKELFEVDSFNGFSMTKLLTTHFIKMEQ